MNQKRKIQRVCTKDINLVSISILSYSILVSSFLIFQRAFGDCLTTFSLHEKCHIPYTRRYQCDCCITRSSLSKTLQLFRFIQLRSFNLTLLKTHSALEQHLESQSLVLQTFKIENFTAIVNGFQLLAVSPKLSILYGCRGP